MLIILCDLGVCSVKLPLYTYREGGMFQLGVAEKVKFSREVKGEGSLPWGSSFHLFGFLLLQFHLVLLKFPVSIFAFAPVNFFLLFCTFPAYWLKFSSAKPLHLPCTWGGGATTSNKETKLKFFHQFLRYFPSVWQQPVKWISRHTHTFTSAWPQLSLHSLDPWNNTIVTEIKVSGLVILLYILKGAEQPGWGFYKARWVVGEIREQWRREWRNFRGWWDMSHSLFAYTHIQLPNWNHTMCSGRAGGEEIEAKYKVTRCIPQVIRRPLHQITMLHGSSFITHTHTSLKENYKAAK